MTVHIIKLSVGSGSLEGLEEWQRTRLKTHGKVFHRTRMAPRRASDLLDGGSIYWVIKGQIVARQPITDVQPVNCDDGITRCDLILKPGLIPVRPTPKRAFQGWRYLAVDDAPEDLDGANDETLKIPPQMRADLVELCLI